MAVFCDDGCFWNALYLFVWWVMLIVLVFDGSLIVFILVVCGAMDVLFLYVCIVVVGCCCLLDLVLCLMLIAFGVSLCCLWVFLGGAGYMLVGVYSCVVCLWVGLVCCGFCACLDFVVYFRCLELTCVALLFD